MNVLEIYSKKPLFGRRQYRWRIKARNGKIIASSSEGYNNRSECIDNIFLLKESLIKNVGDKSEYI